MSNTSDLYNTNPEYRKKHLKYMKTKIQCPCGAKTARANMTTHRKSKKHQRYVQKQQQKEQLIDVTNDELFKKFITHFYKRLSKIPIEDMQEFLNNYSA